MNNLERKEYMIIFNRTKKGIFARMYDAEKTNSKRRGHPRPSYSRDEMISWCYNNNFQELYEDFVRSNYSKSLKPSIDRLDDFKPYTLDNIQLITWGEHLKQSQPKKNISVKQYSIDGVFIREHISIQQAYIFFNKTKGHISDCCKGKRSTTLGYKWQYS